MTVSAKSFRFALLGGLIAGALDIVYAIVLWGFRGVSAVSILQSVASGLLGSRAYDGGVPTAILGLVVHFTLMLIIAAIFYFGARPIGLAQQRPIVTGVLFGVIVYWVMNLVVLPLSSYPSAFAFDPVAIALGLLAHILLIGVPIALATRAGWAEDR
jgi:hypothetical protein